MKRWSEEDHTLKLILDGKILESGSAPLDETACAFFGFDPDMYEKRIIIYYEGREFPSYLEAENAGSVLSWSKALLSRILGEFPDYEDYYQDHPKPEEEAPALLFDKESEDVYVLRLSLPWSESLRKKQAFFDYIGIGDETEVFEDAYEIAFLKNFFEELSGRGQADAFMISGKLKKYFEERQKTYGEQDRRAKKQIEDIENAGLDAVLSFLMEGPYKKYSQMGLMNLKRVDDHFVFALPPELIDEISTDDKNFLVDNLASKLEAYFDRQDAPSLSDSLNAFIIDYSTYFGKDFRYSFKDVILQAIPAGLSNTGLFPSQEYRISGYAGSDTWTEVPYVSVSKKKDRNALIQYLLDKDQMKLYLTVSLDGSEIEKHIRKTGIPNADEVTARALRETADTLRSQMDGGDFSSEVDEVTLSDAKLKNAIIFFREYTDGAPDDQTIEADLKEALDLLGKVENLESEPQPLEEEPKEENAQEISEEEVQEELPEKKPEEIPSSNEETEEEKEEASEEAPKHQEGEEKESEEASRVSEEQVPSEEEEVSEETVLVPEPERTEEEKTEKEEKADQAPEKKKIDAIAKAEEVAAALKEPEVSRISVSKISEAAIHNAQEILKETKRDEKPEKMREEIYEPLSVKEGADEIVRFMRGKGVIVEENDIYNLLLSLKAVPLIGLTGASSSDRDDLIRTFSEAVGADAENGQFTQVRMKNVKDPLALLFGSASRKGIVEEIEEEAQAFPRRPYILYLKDLPSGTQADLLGELISLSDSRHREGGKIRTDAYYVEDHSRTVRLPDNLIISISPEEGYREEDNLSRLSLIQVPELPITPEKGHEEKAKPFAASFITPQYVRFSESGEDDAAFSEVITLLNAMNAVLSKAGARLTRKQMDEIRLYLLENARSGLLSQETALDYILLEKVLPGLHGTGEAVESCLVDLFMICAGTKNRSLVRTYNGQGGLFPKTAKKISEMVKKIDHEGRAAIL